MHTVYIVDDDQLTIDKFWARRRLFMDSGFEICGAATNPLKALEEVRAFRPDAVISDLKMPELSGMGLFEALQSDTLRPLFVIVSAYNEFKDVRKLFLTQGFDYLVKPVADCDLADLLNRLAARLDCRPPVVARQTPSKRLDDILAYLKEYSHMNHTTESVGERFSLSPGGVCNLFARHLNTTFSAYLNALRVERAETLLRTTYKPVKEIAMICGYADALYFTRVFHKARGMSPTRFREAAGLPPAEAAHAE